MQNIRTDWKGLMMPIQKLIMSVTEVMVIDTAASLRVRPMRSGTGRCVDVLLQAASITNVSSIPIPGGKEQAKRVVTGRWAGQWRDCGLHVTTD